MTYALVVVRAFGSHARGDTIVDPKLVAEIEASEHATRVVRVVQPAMKPQE